MHDLLEPGLGGVPGLQGSPASVRTRLMGHGPQEAIHTGYDKWHAVDYLFSPLRKEYLAGEVKGVINSLPTNAGRAVFMSFSIVPVAIAAQRAQAESHRKLLIRDLRGQYRTAIVRAIGGNPKQRSRIRARANAYFGDLSPPLEKTAAYFAAYPIAVEAASGIRRLCEEIEAIEEPTHLRLP